MPTSHESAEEAVDLRVAIRKGFVWDAQDAYLFDIDGTLLRSRDRIHFNSFASSVLQVTGLKISLTGVVLHGGTDTAILHEAFALSGAPEEAWAPHVEAVLEAMRETVTAHRAEMDIWTMPGVQATLAHLARQGALLGLATGNLEVIGWTKVEEAGLREWFRFGGFSDRFVLRSAMIADAAAQARELMREQKSEPTICVVGDTPRDIEAARANHLPVIAVATGHYTFDELAVLEPEVCASSLAALLHATVTDNASELQASEVLPVRS